MGKKEGKVRVYDTWRETQDKLRDCTTEDDVLKLIEAEQTGANRTRWLNRMRGRYKVLRNEREEREGVIAPASTEE